MSEIKISIHIFIKVFALKSTHTCAFCEYFSCIFFFFLFPRLISYTFFLTILKLFDVGIHTLYTYMCGEYVSLFKHTGKNIIRSSPQLERKCSF